MQRLFSKPANAMLATYLIGWIFIAPVLVICTCMQGHTSYAFANHVEPACDQHDDDSGHSHHSDSPGEHQDEQVQTDEFLASMSNLTSALEPLICVGIIEFSDEDGDVLQAFQRRQFAHGPPLSILASISSTILLI